MFGRKTKDYRVAGEPMITVRAKEWNDWFTRHSLTGSPSYDYYSIPSADIKLPMSVVVQALVDVSNLQYEGGKPATAGKFSVSK